MKMSRFTDSQIVDALKRLEARLGVPELTPCQFPPPGGGTTCAFVGPSGSGKSTIDIRCRVFMNLQVAEYRSTVSPSEKSDSHL